MSTHSQTSKIFNKRIDSLQRTRPKRPSSILRKRVISAHDGYIAALRVAYLAYLLQPRRRRTQHVAQKSVSKPSASIQDIMKDFSLLRDSRSTKFPHGFMEKLRDRLSGVITMQEKRPEYQTTANEATDESRIGMRVSGRGGSRCRLEGFGGVSMAK